MKNLLVLLLVGLTMLYSRPAVSGEYDVNGGDYIAGYNWNRDWRGRYILLLKATNDYQEATHFAKNAGKTLNRPIDNEDIKWSQEKGVYYPESDHDAEGYAPRRYSGEEISIENSYAYKGFTPGYLIVVGGIYDDSMSAKKTLHSVRKFYPDAYVKKTVMWMGCIH